MQLQIFVLQEHFSNNLKLKLMIIFDNFLTRSTLILQNSICVHCINYREDFNKNIDFQFTRIETDIHVTNTLYVINISRISRKMISTKYRQYRNDDTRSAF